jgi:hypothetical protein
VGEKERRIRISFGSEYWVIEFIRRGKTIVGSNSMPSDGLNMPSSIATRKVESLLGRGWGVQFKMGEMCKFGIRQRKDNRQGRNGGR